MQTVLHLKRPSRLLAALVASCYCLLSLLMPFQHNHSMPEEMEALLSITGTFTRAGKGATSHSHLSAAVKSPVSARCLACEWQAANVSPALPAFAFTFMPASTPRIVTTLPRYLRVLAFRTSSRGPPLA